MDPSQLTPEQRKELEEKLKNMSPEEIAQLQRQQCIFCQIIDGKVPSKKVYEDETCLVVLDIRPATKGHCLIIPKEHFSIMPQIPDPTLEKLFVTTKVLSKILLKSLRAGGTNIFIANGLAAGQRAPHFMIHLIPRKDADGLFQLEEKGVNLEVQKQVLTKVQNHFKGLMGIETQQTLPRAVEEEPEVEEDEPEEEIEEPEDESSELGEDADIEGDDEVEDDTDESDDETDDEEPEQDENEDEVDASLDDIANLFK